MPATAATPSAANARGVRNVKTTAKVVTAKMKGLAKKFYEENIEANKFRNTADKTRKELLAEMQNGDIASFAVTATIAGNVQTLDVSVGAPESMVVDVAKLKELVDEKTFMRIVSASQKAVEDHAGKVIATRTLVTKVGETNVTVKPVK